MKRKRRDGRHQSRALRAGPVPRPTAHVPKHAADLLVEIGAEELPAAYLPSAVEQLRSETERLLRDAHVALRSVESFGTPRRLVVLVRGLSATQRLPSEEIRGPSAQAAFDKQGRATPALLGFLRTRGGHLSHIKRVATERGEYVYLARAPSTVPTQTILPELLRTLAGRIRFPKTMRWDHSGVRFARPVRWLLALFGGNPIRVVFGRIASGRSTWVGGSVGARSVPVRSASEYFTLLKRHGIVLDPRERTQRIERAVAQLAKHARGVAAPEIVTHGLLEEVAYLVERPVSLVGGFDPKYLELPREVLLASMAKYQRVFAIQAPDGRLLPRFVAILEGKPRTSSKVRIMYEHILNARLADSLLFWRQDHETLPLERLAQRLKDVTFHERLGSMADKTLRLRGLAEPLAETWRLTDEERQHLRRACQLAKADLVSAMVKEFPTLQGVIGKSYARDSGEPESVAAALEEQYLPAPPHGGAPACPDANVSAGRQAGPRLPHTLIGSALALLDKYDTLMGYFWLGIEPTGDEDPFGLRRAAQGVVEVAWAVHRALPLDQLFRASASMEPFRAAQPREIATVGNRVQRYLFERLSTFAWPHPAPSRDLIDAVLASANDDLVDVMDRIVSLSQLDGQKTLLKAAKVVERTRNILKSAAVRQTEVDPARLQEPLEQKLWELYGVHKERLLQLIRDKSYAEATTAYGEVFFETLHEFFERVMVNVREEALQQNRLALMQAINTLYTDRVADLSKLAILQPRSFA